MVVFDSAFQKDRIAGKPVDARHVWRPPKKRDAGIVGVNALQVGRLSGAIHG